MHFKSLFVYLWWVGFLLPSRQEELCGTFNSRTIYLQLGENGSIKHENQTWYNTNTSHCSMELVTCPSCSIQISIIQLDLPQLCTTGAAVNASSEECPCSGLTVWEPSTRSPPVRTCSLDSMNVFTSSTRSVGVTFDLQPQNWTGSFLLTFISRRNQNIFKGGIGDQGTISSPDFPSYYPRDFGIEHIISCESEDCFINLIFTDFLISPTSIMEFYNSDGKPIQLISGSFARPKPIQSSHSSLIIRFFGNGGTSMGYKATYQFFQNSTGLTDINTDCGGEVDNLGGTIFMTGLTGYYDCIWIIQPAVTISHFKTHIYVKVLEYSNGNLTLRNGLTSESRLIGTFMEPHWNAVEHVTPIAKGFYISFKGSILPEDKLVIAYAAFAYMDCLTGIDLLCGNKRCISVQLMCDSVDNCGDNSDEGECKPEEIEKLSGQYWWPMRGSGSSAGQGPGGTLLSLGGALAGAALLLGAALCRVALRPRSPPPPTALHIDHARTIAHLLNIGELDDRDDPPLYEPPPEYNQVIKPARPRRKHSTQRLIERDSSTQRPCEDAAIPSSSLAAEIKKQFVNLPPERIPEMLNNALVRVPDSSPPVSLETTGYNEQDLGLSLTLSTSSHKENPVQNLHWLSAASNKQLSGLPSPANISAASFDTLYSVTEQSFMGIPPTRLIKSHSQDNILWLRTEFTDKEMQDTADSKINLCADHQITKPEKNKQRSLDDTNILDYSSPSSEFQNGSLSSATEIANG